MYFPVMCHYEGIVAGILLYLDVSRRVILCPYRAHFLNVEPCAVKIGQASGHSGNAAAVAGNHK